MPNVGGDRGDHDELGDGWRRRLIAGIVVSVIAADQVTKAWAVGELPGRPVSILGDDVQFRLSFNSGGAFSLLRGVTPVLAVIAIVMAFVLVRALQRSTDRWLLVALALGLGGVVGNLVDRLARSPGFLRGEVVDFVKLWSWPTFNVADAAITVGAVLLVVDFTLGSRTRGLDRSR